MTELGVLTLVCQISAALCADPGVARCRVQSNIGSWGGAAALQRGRRSRRDQPPGGRVCS
jgi:hypothetical protein